MLQTQNVNSIECHDTEVTLTVGVDFTIPKFIEWLDEKFKKTSESKFTPQDVYGYIKRGNLPYHFGIYKLKEINYPKLGIRIVRVTDLNK